MSESAPLDEYSAIADAQLDDLERGPDARLYNCVLETCESILDAPGQARATAAVIITAEGYRFRSHVAGGYPYKVFWSMSGETPRIEAVFPYPA